MTRALNSCLSFYIGHHILFVNSNAIQFKVRVRSQKFLGLGIYYNLNDNANSIHKEYKKYYEFLPFFLYKGRNL